MPAVASEFPTLKASTDYSGLVIASENSLKKLGMTFARSGSNVVTEFEITYPAYFRIVIEPNAIPKSRNLLVPSIFPPKGSTISIRFDIDSNTSDVIIAKKSAAKFVQSLIEALPTKPWMGLGLLESSRAEKKWKNCIP